MLHKFHHYFTPYHHFYGHTISAELMDRIMATVDQWQSLGFGTEEINIILVKVSYEQKGCQEVLPTLTYSLQLCYLPPPTYP